MGSMGRFCEWPSEKLYALDSLRGIAALSIVVWHWQHFFAIRGEWMDGWRPSMEPLYVFLKPLYLQGWAAVDLFFVLSGFVFFWLYGEAIREGRMGAGRFASLRFSRLYPLHLATLLLVTVMQFYFHRATSYFIFDADDWQRFAGEHLDTSAAMAAADHRTVLQRPGLVGVSIEVLLYAVFFLVCRLGLRGPGLALDLHPRHTAIVVEIRLSPAA